MSDLRATNIKGRTGAIAPNLPSGMNASGVTTAIDMVVGGGTTTTGPVRIDNTLGAGVTLNTSGVIAAGIITAAQFKGDGSELTGVSGFATALYSDNTSFLNQVFKTSRVDGPGAGTSVTVTSDATSGNMAFTRLAQISVGTGATLHVSTGVTFVTDVLAIF